MIVNGVFWTLPFRTVHKGDRVALMINGLGGTPISELDLLYGRRPPAKRVAAKAVSRARRACKSRHQEWANGPGFQAREIPSRSTNSPGLL